MASYLVSPQITGVDHRSFGRPAALYALSAFDASLSVQSQWSQVAVPAQIQLLCSQLKPEFQQSVMLSSDRLLFINPGVFALCCIILFVTLIAQSLIYSKAQGHDGYSNACHAYVGQKSL